MFYVPYMLMISAMCCILTIHTCLRVQCIVCKMGRPLVDGRHTMLEVAMFRHLQFDSLRR